MSPTDAEIEEIARKYPEEVLTDGNLEVMDEVFADDYVSRNSAFPEPMDLDGLKEYTSMALTAFPDLEVTVEELIVIEDKVVRRDRFTGTHEGEFMGIAPTGKEIDIEAVEIFRIEDRQIAEARRLLDMLGLLQQLGVLEPPG